MKILYFFDIYDFGINENILEKFYNYLKKSEINKINSVLKKKFKNYDLTIQIYCLYKENNYLIQKLNKESNYLKKNEYDPSIKSTLNEYLNIERICYKRIIAKVWYNTKDFYKKLLSTDFIKLNYFWKIYEYYIKREIEAYFEQVEFITSIVNREKPDIVLLSQRELNFFKLLIHKINFPLNKIFFTRNKLNIFFHRINKLVNIIRKISHKLRNLFFSLNIYRMIKRIYCVQIINHRNKDAISHTKKKAFIGISLPTTYYLKGIEPIYKELKNEYINIRFLDDSIFRYNLSLNDSIRIGFIIRRIWKKNSNNYRIVKNLDDEVKNLGFSILKNLFFYNIIDFIYWSKGIEREIKNNDYRVIVTANEFGPKQRLLCLIPQKYQIPIYFTPYVGIPQFGSYITPNLSNTINVDGILDKKYLISKGVNPNKIVVRGSPIYEEILKKKIKKIYKLTDYFTGKVFNLSQNKIKILLTTNPISDKSNTIIITKVIKVLKNLKNIQLIIKLHPREKGILQKEIINTLNYSANIVKEINIFSIIKSSDILLTQDSVTILDSMVVGTPVICLDFINKRVGASGKHIYNNEEYVIKVYGEQELYNQLKLLLNSSGELEEYKRKLSRNLGLFLYNELNYFPTKKICSDLLNYLK